MSRRPLSSNWARMPRSPNTAWSHYPCLALNLVATAMWQALSIALCTHSPILGIGLVGNIYLDFWVYFPPHAGSSLPFKTQPFNSQQLQQPQSLIFAFSDHQNCFAFSWAPTPRVSQEIALRQSSRVIMRLTSWVSLVSGIVSWCLLSSIAWKLLPHVFWLVVRKNQIWLCWG